MASLPPPPSRASDAPARTLARRPGRAGELALRARDGDYEIISNGTFLMDTSDGRSERLLVRAALEAAPRDADRRVLLAGLGVGFSLAEALATTGVAAVHVVEWEPAIVTWHRTTLGARTGGDLDDPRVRLEVTDVVDWLRRPGPARYDVLCLDVDNGPHWTVSPTNRWLYEDDGLAAVRRRLVDGGVLAVWSSARVPTFERRLRRMLRGVDRLEVPVPRGAPDVIYLARR